MRSSADTRGEAARPGATDPAGGILVRVTSRARRTTILCGIIFAVVLCIAVAACSDDETPTLAAPAADPDALSILFIGNSLTYVNDLPGMLLAMLELADIGPVQVQSLAFPNWGLEDHWSLGDARSVIAQGGWDLIIMQQGPSATEGRPSLLEYSERFDGVAEAIGATVAMYMVWPAQQRFFDFNGVRNSYLTAAQNIDGLFFPAGEAWRDAWDENPDLALYGADDFHPTVMGTYLAALTMYEQITGKPASTVPAELTLESGAVVTIEIANLRPLRRATTRANAEFGRDVAGWPIGSE